MAVLCRAFICIISVQFVTFNLEAAGSACKPGYHGRYCTNVCRYPSYGPLCQEGCNCSEEYCHHITGCLNSDVTHNTTEGQSIIKETSKLVPELSTLMNDHVDLARTSAAKIQSAIKMTQLVSEQSTVNYDGTISTTASSLTDYSKRPSEKVSMSTFAVQENKQDSCQRLPLYVCFAFISLLAALNMFLLVRFRKNIRRAVKAEHVKNNEHEYVTVRSEVRSEAMYTIPERNEGASYQEPNETNMID
ncbi:uncharacterized protein LOC111104903 isoform X1 [Crassostrea virginica]